MPKLHVFPEGCSTNGKYVITFKKGAFVSLRPVQPVVINYHTIAHSASQDIVGFVPHTLVVMLCYGIKISVKKMPVFEPNEFFW